jgi:hypothetical protein
MIKIKIYLALRSESISSINITDGLVFLANSNKDLTNLSDSPIHLEIILAAESE